MTDLFSLPPEVEQADMQPRARATDPATSHAAAAKAKRFAITHCAQITGVLFKPRIPPEIARLTGLTVVQVDRRRKELLERGAIRLTGVVREGYEEWDQVLN